MDHISALKDIVGASHVLTEDSEKHGYETPWRGEAGRASFVVRPKDTDEVAKILAYFHAQKIRFVAQSGNTGLVGASTPDQSGEQAVLSLNRLTDIFDISPANKSAHVGAGVKLSALNDRAAAQGIFFPIDLGSDPCIGGMIATNTGGSRLLKYGDVRQNLLGLTAVLMDGTILRMNNMLYKNNTGLDLKQLFIGAGGRAGIITEAVVKLSVVPQQRATALVVPQSLEAVPDLLLACECRFGDEISAFEGMSKNALEAVFAQKGSGIKNGFPNGIPDYVCLIELNRTWPPRAGEMTLDDILQDGLGGIMETQDSLIDDALFGHPAQHWALRHAISEAVQHAGKMVSFDISFSRDRAMAFRDFMDEALIEHCPDIKICDFGHIGDGAMHFNLVLDPADPRLQNPSFIPELRAWVLEKVVTEFGGSFSAEHGIGPLNQSAYDHYTPDEIKALAARLMREMND